MLQRNMTEEASFTARTERTATMKTESHWAATAAAIEARIEGDRLIALEIGALLAKGWHAVQRWFVETTAHVSTARHLPPV